MQRTFAILLSLVCAIALTACGDKAGGPVGTWVIDSSKAADAAAAMAEKQIAAASPEARQQIEAMLGATPAARREKALEQAKGLTMEMTIAADKTFTSTSNDPGSDVVDAGKGTWSEKDGKIILTQTSKNGGPVTGADARPVTAHMAGSNLVVEVGPGFELPLKRK